MPTILKRFEIWLLFVLVISGFWWAYQVKPIVETQILESSNPRIPSSSITAQPGLEAAPADATLLVVRKVNVTPLDQGTIVELTLLGCSGTDQPVALDSDNVELLTADGEGVHRFFTPFEPDPMLAADEKSLVTLKYWLDSPVEVLWLTYRDQTVKVEIPAISI
jgi:hypothetical protein